MSIKKNIFYNVSLSVLNVLFPIVTAPYISRVLGVENVGVVRFVITYVSYFVLLAALGIGYYGVREMAKCKDDQEKCSQLFSSLFIITLCSTLLVTLLFLLSVNLIPAFKEHRLLFSLYGITLYIVPITMDWCFQAKENFKIITIRSFIIKLLAFASLFIFVRQRSDVIPYICISTFSIVGAQVWNLIYAHKIGLRIKLSHIALRCHIRSMLVFMWSNIAIYAYTTIDVLMLKTLSFYEQVGYYTSSSIILSAFVGISMAINSVLLPRLSSNKTKQKDDVNDVLLQKAFDLCVFFIVPLAVGIFLSAPRFVPVFFGNEFIGSVIPLQILSLKMMFLMLNSFWGVSILIARGYEKQYLLVITCAIFFLFIFNLLLIPNYGAIGAAISSVIIEAFSFGLLLHIAHKFTKIQMRWIIMKKAFLFTLPFFALYYFCNKFILSDIAFLCMFGCVSAVVYFLLQWLAKNYLLNQVISDLWIGKNCNLK